MMKFLKLTSFPTQYEGQAKRTATEKNTGVQSFS
jgi:hypothetical protein